MLPTIIYIQIQMEIKFASIVIQPVLHAITVIAQDVRMAIFIQLPPFQVPSMVVVFCVKVVV